MKNYGIAQVKVEILDSLPGIEPNPSKNHVDVTAQSFKYEKDSAKLKPINLDTLDDGDKDSKIMAMFPIKQEYAVDNYINNGDIIDPAEFNGKTAPPVSTSSIKVPESAYIMWTPIDLNKLKGINAIPTIATSIIEGWPVYTLVSPLQYGNATIPVQNNGPYWTNYLEDPQVNLDNYRDFYTTFNTVFSEIGNEQELFHYFSIFPQKPITSGIKQNTAKDGMWWAVESSAFLQDDMPFWVVIKRNGASPPETGKTPHATSFVISLGIDSGNSEDRFDLRIEDNRPAQLIDYRFVTVKDGVITGQPVSVDFKTKDSELAIIDKSENPLKIGFMTVAGRLVVFVGKNRLVYTRTNKKETDGSSTFVPCKIKEGKIRVFGTNVSATIRVEAMTFHPAAIAFFDIADINAIFKSYGVNSSNIIFQPVTTDNIPIPNNTVISLPKSTKDTTAGAKFTSKDKLFGADCNKFVDANGENSPEGIAFHKQGKIYFRLLKDSTIGTLNKDIDGCNYYSLEFYTWPITFKNFASLSYTTPVIPATSTTAEVPAGFNEVNSQYYFFGGCPYFFKLKGKVDVPYTAKPITSLDVTDSVISVSESTTADGYVALKTTANLTLYNKSGYFDFLRSKQRGLRITWGWIDYTGKSSKQKRTFTGIIVSSNCSSVAGKEILSLVCEDYMHILSNSIILNSPIYDGMLIKSIVADLAESAGILNIVYKWNNYSEFFAPSGYSFNAPRMKFEYTSKRYDKMTYCLGMCQAYMFFDGDGVFHIEFVPNGILSATEADLSDPTKWIDFSSDPSKLTTVDPSGRTYSGIILDEKNIDVSFASTVSEINAMTVEMDDGKPVFDVLKSTDPSNINGPANVIPFKKTGYLDQPAFGGGKALTVALHLYGQHIFYPTAKINFKVVGSSSIIDVLSYIKVDDIPFRLLSVKREFNAENNTFEQNFEGEWLGGKINSDFPTPSPLT